MILVSACLAGINSNHKGKNSFNKRVVELITRGKAIPICPEQLGGLTTPRDGARILNGSGDDVLDGRSKVITDKGEDVTGQYIKGANLTLAIAKQFNASIIISKQGSPSCGNGNVQGGLESRNTVKGVGVTVTLLKRNGTKIFTEDDLDNEEIWKEILED